jgi:hypothetical protein
MSWDIVLFNTTYKIDDFESFNADNLAPINFGQTFEGYFKDIKKDNDSWEIIEKDFTIVHYPDDEPTTNCMINLYGENAIYAIVHLARVNGWQVFDTGLGEMLDLDNPSNNGYDNFQDYLKHVIIT